MAEENAKRRGRPRGAQGINKSQAIREYLEANPNIAPREAAEALGQQGIAVSPGYVSAIKSKAKSKRRGRKRRTRGTGGATGVRAMASAPRAGGRLSLDQLIAAKKFADSMGGIARARAALEALEKVTR